MLQIKVCGMREARNISDLIAVQPNFIGFIFHEGSSRNCTQKPLIKIPKAINKVGVFVNKSIEFILDKVKVFNLDYVQLHGNEKVSFCEELNGKDIQVIKAFNIHSKFNFNQLAEYEQSCFYFLFDASGQRPGGNGIVFDWELLQKYNGKTPFLLSGGINETMVEKIKSIKHPKFVGVDINSGFEIEVALKNISKIKTFYHELRS